MACSCSKKTTDGKPQSYVVTKPDGTQTVRRTEIEAAALAQRSGGTMRPQPA